MPFRYPVALELTGRPCVVIGGDATAEGKVRALMEAGATVVVLATTHTPGLEDLGRRGELWLAGRPYQPGDLDGAFLVVCCDPALNDAVYAEADAHGVLCNAVDDVGACHFAVPSIVRRGDLLVAVSTGGQSPALAKRLRRRLSATFGWEYEALVGIFGAIRAVALTRRTVDFATWAKRWEAAVAEEDALVVLVREGRLDEVRARVWAHLDGRAGAAGCDDERGDDLVAPPEVGAWPEPGSCGVSDRSV